MSVEEGDKVDFWMLSGDSFDQMRFSRRTAKRIAGVPIWVSTPEDTILAKLRWCRLSGGSEKHLVDALRVYEVQRGTLDDDYIAQWAEETGVTDLMGENQNRSQ